MFWKVLSTRDFLFAQMETKRWRSFNLQIAGYFIVVFQLPHAFTICAYHCGSSGHIAVECVTGFVYSPYLLFISH